MITPSFLPLGEDAIRSPNAFHLGVLRAYMFFPDDEHLRQRALVGATVEHGLELMKAGQLTSSQTMDVAQAAHEAVSPLDFSKIAGDRPDKGLAAGYILWSSCRALAEGETGALGERKKRIGSVLYRGNNDSSQTDTEVWRVYKPAAALWATFVHFENSARAEDPCDRNFLPEWLSFFNAIRELAEATRTHGKGGPVLKKNESFQLMPAVVKLLPPSKLGAGA